MVHNIFLNILLLCSNLILLKFDNPAILIILNFFINENLKSKFIFFKLPPLKSSLYFFKKFKLINEL